MNSTDMDWAALAQRLGGPQILRPILQNLFHHHRDTPAQLRQLAQTNAVEPLTVLAHQLRGVAQYLSDAPTELAAKALENDLKSTGSIDAEKVQTLTARLEVLLASAEEFISVRC